MFKRWRTASHEDADKSLMARAAHGFAWVFAWRMTTRIMGLGSTLILVRLLAPAEFGIVAIAMSFLSSIDQFSQIGVEEALVRMPAPEQRTYDTAFTMIALRCGLIAAMIVAAALPVAGFFAEPRLTPIMLAIAGVTLISGFENVGMLDLRRDMRFDQEFLYQALPRVVSIVVTVTAALIWRNYWALIIGTGTSRVMRVVMSYQMHPMRPRFNLAAWRELVGFSLWTWAIGVARVLRDQPSTFIVGRALGTAKLGVLSVAAEIALLPSTEIVLPMGRSMFSAFALARRSGEDVEVIYRRLVGLTAMVTMPASVGLALVAEPLVRLMLGPTWMEAAPLMQIVAIGSVLAVFGHACHAQFDAFGLLRQDFQAILFGAAARLALVALLVPGYGLVGAAWGGAVSMLLEAVAYQAMKWRTLPYSPRALVEAVIRPFVATVGMGAVVWWTGLANASSSADTIQLIEQLAATVLAGAGCYAGLVFVLWWVAGRPAGTEADILWAVGRRGWVRRPAPAGL